MENIERAIFGYYPYLCLTVLVVGVLYRFEREQYTWQASSSQLLRAKPSFNLASNLFHLGVLGLVGGHFAGLVVPPAVWHLFGVTGAMHQVMELVMGSITGLMALVGLSMLLYRRVTDERVRSASSPADFAIVLLLWGTLVVGMGTLPFSYETRDTGIHMHHLSLWSQAILTLDAAAATHLAGVPWVFKFHIFSGLTVFLLFPFTRLVHVCSAPLGYLTRSYTQIVRARS